MRGLCSSFPVTWFRAKSLIPEEPIPVHWSWGLHRILGSQISPVVSWGWCREDEEVEPSWCPELWPAEPAVPSSSPSSPSAPLKSMGLNEHKWEGSWLLRCCGKSVWKLASVHLSKALYWISADSSNNDNRYGQSCFVFSLEGARFPPPAHRHANRTASSCLSGILRVR